MPAGVSWGQYIKFLSCAMLSMMAGSQIVHIYYKPLDDISAYIDREKLGKANGLTEGHTMDESLTKN